MIGSIKRAVAVNGDFTQTHRITVTSSSCKDNDESLMVLCSMLKMLATDPVIFNTPNHPSFDNFKLHHDGEKWVGVFTSTVHEKKESS